MKVTVVIENKTYREPLLGQYGLSLLLETDSGCVLMDAGSDESALTNYKSLGLSLSAIDAIVVSHNHFDHFGGMPYFIENTGAKVYMSSDASHMYYTKSFLHRRNLVSRTDVIEKYSDRFSFVEDQTEILPGLFVCRIKNANADFFCKDRRLKQVSNGKLVPDGFAHEVYVAVMEEGKLKIVSSCSHNGIVNILSDAGRRFPGVPITAFVGGLHMKGNSSRTMNCSKQYAETVFSIAENIGVKKLYTGHCTGKKAFALLQKHSAIESYYFSTGDTFVL